MNLVLQANINYLMAKDVVVKKPIVKKPVAVNPVVILRRDSIAGDIIKYLLKHGETTGVDLIHKLKLTGSASAHIRTHIKAKRVLVENINATKAIYKINPDFDVSLFRFDGSVKNKEVWV